MPGQPIRAAGLLLLVLAYAAASLLHHAHNAAYLADYPNMPAWLTPAGVFAAWAGVTAVGVAGWLLVRHGYRAAGIGALALYAALGLYGLAHYGVAPLSAHTAGMNFTIWLEVATATLVLVGIARLALKHARERARRA
jgi:hypothetical protein